MNTPPALTAFFSSVQLYDMLTLEEKQLVDHSWVEYAPHPFKWIERCKSRNTGLGIAGGGQLTEEELPEYDPAKYGERSMHKSDTGGSIGPRGPVPVPAY